MTRAAEGQVRLAGMKYLVEAVLDTEGSSVVRIGDQGSLGTQYALKIIKRGSEEDDEDEPKRKKGNPDEEFAGALERARAVLAASQKVNHKGILKYHDLQLKRQWFRAVRADLLMEFVAGLSLKELKKLDVSHAVIAAGQLAGALAHMHRRGVIHGDLKPSRVMLSQAGMVKVLGYGQNLLTDRAHVKTSRLYAAPEQIKSGEVSELADVYGMAATLYHCVTGRAPNTGSRETGEGGKIPLPSALNPAIPKDLNNLLVTCLQSDPAKRPASMYEAQEKIDAIVKKMGLEEHSLRNVAQVGASE